MGWARTQITLTVAFAAATAILAGAVWFDAAGTAANVIADVFLAATLTISGRAYLLVRDRRRYATEVRLAQKPLRERLFAVHEYLSCRSARAAEWSIPAGPYDWADFLPGGDRWNPYDALNPDWPASELRPSRIDVALEVPPTSEADLLATFDALHSGYPGPDLTPNLIELAEVVTRVPQAWRVFAERYNAMEALAPAPLMFGLAVDAEVMRDIREPEEAAYRAAAGPTKEAARLLREQHVAVQDLLRQLRSQLDDGYDPGKLASRDTPDPFPQWVVRGAVAAAAISALAWVVCFAFDDLGRDITDNILVGLAATATGVGVATIAAHLAKQRVAREAREPHADLVEAAKTLAAAEHPGGDTPAVEVLWATRNKIRNAVHQLQYIVPNRRLDTYGDLAVDRIDAWLDSTSPNEVVRLRMMAALTQLNELANVLSQQ